ncbi:MAG TPA: ABC transporter permease [Terriglobia bacterium]|nr:ABC transporter permease [Terriglobia bacterium]
MTTLFRDLRYGIRMLAKSPGFTAVAVLTLALGIGANSTIFTTINAMLLRPFAIQDLDRTVFVWESIPRQDEYHLGVAPANFRDWKAQAKGFELLAAGRNWDVNLTGTGIAERVEAYQVTPDFFRLVGLPALFGRAIGADDFQSGRASVIVLSYGFWKAHLGGDPGMVGKNVLLNGEKYTVVGIMPRDCDFPVGTEAWAPLDLSGAGVADRTNHYLQVIGRLKPGVPPAQAQADLEAISSRLARDYPATNSGHGTKIVGVVEDLTGGSRQFVSVLMGAAGFVLLLACANVANLMLARATAREKEIAVRRALGATRWQIARQLLVESLCLALLGGVAGLLLAAWGLDLLRTTIPPFIVQHIAGLKHLEVDSHVLIFTLVVALLTGIIAGLAPALQISHPDLSEALKEGARGGTSSPARRRLRAGLVVTEIALALVLLVGAGIMVEGFGNLMNTDQGFDRTHVLAFRVALPETKYREKDRIRSFYHQAIEKLQRLPGVESAAAITSVPSSWSWNSSEYTAESQPPADPGEMRVAATQSVSPELFRVLRLPLLKGRAITAEDGQEAPPVVVVSQQLARRIWGGQDPIGKRLKMGRPESKEPWRTVVGVVGDIKQSPMDRNPHPTAYFSVDQLPQASSGIVVRTLGNPLALAASVRAVVKSVDPQLPAYDVRSIEQMVSDNISGVQSSANMMMVFGMVALVLAAAGIFALMAYTVVQRTHEIGVRMTLGAQRADVLRLVVGYSIKLAMMGLAIGVPVAWAITRAMTRFLFGLVRLDNLILIGFTVLLAGVAVLAAYVPARRASKVDPMVALRYE